MKIRDRTGPAANIEVITFNVNRGNPCGRKLKIKRGRPDVAVLISAEIQPVRQNLRFVVPDNRNAPVELLRPSFSQKRNRR